jgi:hypothetical protein
MSEAFLARWVQNLASWLSILVSIGGVVVTAAYLKRSRWVALLFGAFVAEVILQAASRLALPLVIRSAGTDTARIPTLISTVFLLSSVLGVIAHAAMVLGIAGVLSAWARRGNTPMPD